YPHPLLEGILKNTYGIMVYQEQIMQAARIIADYTLGEADILRKIMGKKKPELLPPEEKKFVPRAVSKGIDEKKAKEIFEIMAHFGGYGFNRSHSAAYSVIAYQTAYLKAHYPAEYMAAVLTNNMNNIDKVTFFIDECKRQNIEVLGPDINESNIHFDINKDRKIRFGLGAIKGTGEAAAMEIISDREKNGHYKDTFDFAQRINLRTVNKKTFESLAYSGAFESFTEIHRAQYFYKPDNEQEILIEKIIKFGNTFQLEKNAAQQSLFGNGQNGAELSTPPIPDTEPWGEIEKLRLEKEVVGFYISGHPLDQFRIDLDTFCTCTVDKIENHKNRSIAVAGIVNKVNIRQGKTGQQYALFTIEDYVDSLDLAVFGEDYLKMAHLLNPGEFLFIKGTVGLRYNSTDRWDLKPHTIHLLSEIRTKLSKALTIQIDLQKIDDTKLKEIERITQENPGKCELRFSIYDFSNSGKSENKDMITVEMLSRKMRVNPHNDLIDKLSEMDGVFCKLIPV
ncbi:MAG: DNA polymerase III subunit alpha, partial [Bacteroidetes bacterium]|nr:DNA polymerase III subunit alpha [Bacteroidota bacterium]